jgi:Zn finger protein HypA/HybF involved in hydrogenase expression
MKIRKGKWIPAEITGCMTLVPIFQCSRCKYIQSGYLTTEACTNCGSINTVDKTKDVEIEAISKFLEQLGN